MCDDDTINDMIALARRSAHLSRRRFGALSLYTGLTVLLPRAANALEVRDNEVEIRTPDGTCDAYFVHPAGGTHAGVLVWPDGGGLRPAFRQMGKRLAESGYSVLVVNQFYRTRRAPVRDPNADMQDEAVRKALQAMSQSLNPTTHVTDARAFVQWLDGQPVVDRRRKLGTMGYCSGGPITMRTAAASPERIGAAASFHGGGLVTDNADSPHLLVPKMKARYLIAIAENDDQRRPDDKSVLRDSFARANLSAEIEVYAGALHGWCPPDGRVYNEAQAERAWARLLELFGKALA